MVAGLLMLVVLLCLVYADAAAYAEEMTIAVARKVYELGRDSRYILEDTACLYCLRLEHSILRELQ